MRGVPYCETKSENNMLPAKIYLTYNITMRYIVCYRYVMIHSSVLDVNLGSKYGTASLVQR